MLKKAYLPSLHLTSEKMAEGTGLWSDFDSSGDCLCCVAKVVMGAWFVEFETVAITRWLDVYGFAGCLISKRSVLGSDSEFRFVLIDPRHGGANLHGQFLRI